MLPGRSPTARSDFLPQQRHAALDVERRAHARERSSPSSTSVIATAGLHADDDRLRVEHARHRRDVGDHAADERVDHLERRDVDQHARARGRARCAAVRSSCSVSASRSCMSTWIVTSRQSPILQNRNAFHRHALSARRSARRDRRAPVRFSATANASASVALVDDVAEIDAEMHDRLRDLRPDAADDAVGAHQPRRRHGLQQMLRDQRVDRRHAGDVDDRDLRARSRRSAAAGSPSRPACARCRACRSAAARGCRPTA